MFLAEVEIIIRPFEEHTRKTFVKKQVQFNITQAISDAEIP